MQNDPQSNTQEFSEELWQSNANPSTPTPTTPPKTENVLAGTIGAFLFSLVGVALYFVLYQINILAAICGLVIVTMAAYGYQLFSGKKNSLIGIVVSVVMLLVMIPVAEYLSLSYVVMEVFSEEPEFSLSFFEAMRVLPELLTDPEVGPELIPEVIQELLISYALGIIGAVSSISVALRNRKAAAAAAQIPPENPNPGEL